MRQMGIMTGCRSVVGSTSTTFCRMTMDHDLELHRCRALRRHLEGQSWVTATERMEAVLCVCASTAAVGLDVM